MPLTTVPGVDGELCDQRVGVLGVGILTWTDCRETAHHCRAVLVGFHGHQHPEIGHRWAHDRLRPRGRGVGAAHLVRQDGQVGVLGPGALLDLGDRRRLGGQGQSHRGGVCRVGRAGVGVSHVTSLRGLLTHGGLARAMMRMDGPGRFAGGVAPAVGTDEVTQESSEGSGISESSGQQVGRTACTARPAESLPLC